MAIGSGLFFPLGTLYSIGILFYSFALRYFKEAPPLFIVTNTPPTHSEACRYKLYESIIVKAAEQQQQQKNHQLKHSSRHGFKIILLLLLYLPLRAFVSLQRFVIIIMVYLGYSVRTHQFHRFTITTTSAD